MAATVIPIGQPVNDDERRAIAHLRDGLPASYTLLHNFVIQRDQERYEIDLALLAPHALYLVDVKGTAGHIDVIGPRWYPANRTPFTSPLLKLENHARALKGMIVDSQPGYQPLNNIYVAAVVLLTAPDVEFADPSGRDAARVTTLARSLAFFQDARPIPPRFNKNTTGVHRMILSLLRGRAVARPSEQIYGNWRVVEQLSATDAYTEYRAVNATLGEKAGSARLRIYQADPYLDTEARRQQQHRIANAYRALNAMPTHQNIVGARDFFQTEGQDRFVLVTDDVQGQVLRLYLQKPSYALTLDQKLRIARHLFAALAHAHSYGVIHRNLTPNTMLIGADGGLRLINFDFARAGSDRSRTIAAEIIDELEPFYLAPEVQGDPGAASSASDIFSAGLVLYELFTGERPFNSPTEMAEQRGVFAVRPLHVRPDLPGGLDDWLQRLCTFDPSARPSAQQAADALALLVDPGRDLRADEFIEKVLSITGGEIAPLLALMDNEETDWLEFKAALQPDPSQPAPPDLNDADHAWHVARAIVAMANSGGGAVLLGVDDGGNPVPLSASDPNGRLADGWDSFARRVLDKAFFRPNGWKTFKRGQWIVDEDYLKSCLTVRRATLRGEDIVLLLVQPAQSDQTLLFTTHIKDNVTTENILFVRRRGDVGNVERLEGSNEIALWLQNRQLRSPRFAAYLQQIKDQQDRLQPKAPAGAKAAPTLDYQNLPPRTQLAGKFVVERRLGKPGAFGAVYKVIDTFGDVPRALKIIYQDRISPFGRLQTEYRNLLHTPEHPNVVRVIDANLLPPTNIPYLVFEYIDGADVAEMIANGSLSPQDVLTLAKEVVAGLVHIHSYNTFHCDIKPSNLLWTNSGVRIIDFNVSLRSEQEEGRGGGSRRYLPPDLDPSLPAVPETLADRDLYALGITLYEALTGGGYPWDTDTPPPGQPPRDPITLPNLKDLTPEFAQILLKCIAPRNVDRFAGATALRDALAPIKHARRLRPSTSELLGLPNGVAVGAPARPNTNPFVENLLTLYSQSRHTNAGTRGLDDFARTIYVSTALDNELLPAALDGEFRLFIITGNAGDGKTAFLQQLESAAQRAGAHSREMLANGASFVLDGRTYLTNYDGSQDEGETSNDDVLLKFFEPYAGESASDWPMSEVRLIAINEGRLIDFLTAYQQRFLLLDRIVRSGLQTGAPNHQVAVVNLNLRNVIAIEPDSGKSIFRRLIERMTRPEAWAACHACDLKERCYAFHNAQTFQDQTVGPKVIERLETLYVLTHLRNVRHFTMREIRSALAFMLVGTRTCDEIHSLYVNGDRNAIVQGYYFNSWLGSDAPTADPLLHHLKSVDVGAVTEPRLDRLLSSVSPQEDRNLLNFEDRSGYVSDIMNAHFEELPQNVSSADFANRIDLHRRYLTLSRRRFYFERRDDGWRNMLPYRRAEEMLALVGGQKELEPALPELISAISRGEGLTDPKRLDARLALQVRRVEQGTIYSYRVFPAERFSLKIADKAERARFVEHMADGLLLRYQGESGIVADLEINLDIFEMLMRLNEGYRPTVEERQGYLLSLEVFKNLLASEPYQEVLLTTRGHDFYHIKRDPAGRLFMQMLDLEAA